MPNTALAGDNTQPSNQQLPFTVGAALSTRQAFTLPATLTNTSITQPVGTPVNLGSFGWVSNIFLDIALTYTNGASLPTFTSDGIDTLINSVGVRTAGGAPLIQPIDGYTLHVDNIFGGKRFGLHAPQLGSDPDLLPGTALGFGTVSTANTMRIFRALQFEIDGSEAFGCIPATAANREFTIDMTFGSLSSIFATNVPTTATVTVTATVVYWDLPPDGAVPPGVTGGSQSLRLLLNEKSPVNAGENKIKSNNVGNVIMNHYLIFRNGSNVRDDADFSDPFQIDIDNNARFWLTKDVWKAAMAAWFGLSNAIDTAGGLRSGVYVMPYRLLAGGVAADAYSSRAQYLTTLNTTQLVMHGLNYGAAGSLQITADVVSSPDVRFVYSK